MKAAPFTLHRARSLAEAVDLLAEAGAQGRLAKPLAGGQSLVPMLNLRLAPLDALVDLRGVAELRATSEDGGVVRYGAMIPHAAFEDGTVPDPANGLLRHVAGRIAYRAIRTRGTIGGSVALADPAADWLVPLIALGAQVEVAGPAGTRRLPVAEFVIGPYFTDLGEADVLAAILIPRRPATERWGQGKLALKLGEYAKSHVIALHDPAAGTAQVVLGALEGAPLVMAEAAASLAAGRLPGRDALEAELAASGRDLTPVQIRMHATTAQRAMGQAMEAAA